MDVSENPFLSICLLRRRLTGFVFTNGASIASDTWVNSSRELQLLAYATAVVSLLTHTSYQSRVAPFYCRTSQPFSH
jgi:hypothetical protein